MEQGGHEAGGAPAADEGALGYRGPDRRTPMGRRRGPSGPPFVAAALLLIVIWSGVSLAGMRAWGLPDWVDPAALNALIVAATALVGVAVAVTYGLRWRVVGEATALLVAAAVAVLALGGSVAADLVPVAVPELDGSVALDALRAASTVTALLLLVTAARGPDVDTRLGVTWLALRTAPLLGSLAALFALLPASAGVFESSVSAGPRQPFELAGQALVAMAWLALAARFALAGLRRERWLHTWLGLGLFAVALGTVSSAPVTAPGELWLTGAALLELVGMLLVLLGAAVELEAAWAQQQGMLLRTRQRLAAREEEWRAELAFHEERAHDARSMVLAIQGAVAGLERAHDDLDGDARAALTHAVGQEIARLQRLVDLDPTPRAERERFDLADVVHSVITCHRSTELGLTGEIAGELPAVGSPHDTAEALHSLLDNARQHADGAPVLVRAGREMGNVVVRVEDRGPGVEPQEREAIFERGRRGSGAAPGGSGLGLSVARRLVRAQGGDLWLEGRPGGGASFVLFVPGAGDPAPRPAREPAALTLPRALVTQEPA